MHKVLLTGASGFVGKGVLQRLITDGIEVTTTSRRVWNSAPSFSTHCIVDSILGNTDWRIAVRGQRTVVHCAARVHVMNDSSKNPLEAFRDVNFHGTLNLARQAVEAEARRFIFISSIGVNGAETFDLPFNSDAAAAPHSPYSLSKYEAEMGLLQLAENTGLEVVIIRPPLVYGPNAPGNFGSLLRWLWRGVPLPFGAIDNRRSLVALGNLVDLIVTCIDHPAAANQTFLVSDGEDLSTTQLLRRMGRALGKPARLVPVSPALLKLGAALVGRPDVAQRLCGSLQVDISKTRQLLGWAPPLSVDEGLKKAAEGYLREASV